MVRVLEHYIEMLLLISLLLFGLTIASSHREDLHQDEERQDTVSKTNRPGTVRRNGQSPSSDPLQGYHNFMRRSDDEENFDNLLQHSPADFILRPLQMLDFSRNIFSFMAKPEDEHENLGRSIIERIRRVGDIMRDRIRDNFAQHGRFRRGAKGESSSPYPVNYQYGHPVMYDGTPQYIPAPQNSYSYHHCSLLETHIPEEGHSSKRGHRSTDRKRNGHGEYNHVVICEIPEHSCLCPPQKEHICEETIDDSDEDNVNITISEEYQNGDNGKQKDEIKPSNNGHSNNHNNNNNNNNGYSNNGNKAMPFPPFEMPESNGEGELMYS